MPIKDQAKYRELELELKRLETLHSLRPFLILNGSRGFKAAAVIDNTLGDELTKLKSQFERQRELPDRFNAAFGECGWIASEDSSVDAMEKALQIKEELDLEAAEQFLEDHHNERLEFFLRRFWVLPQIKARYQLISLALEDHKAGRYHASVPVILAQIDGITFDLVSKSFYETGKKKTKHLQAKETIVGDPTGLAHLAALLSQGRSATTANPTELPYRHGVLHGRDLGYANRRNSTKAFSALLALRPWILKAQEGKQFTEQTARNYEIEIRKLDDMREQLNRYVEVLQGLIDLKARIG